MMTAMLTVREHPRRRRASTTSGASTRTPSTTRPATRAPRSAARARASVTADQAAALASVRDVPRASVAGGLAVGRLTIAAWPPRFERRTDAARSRDFAWCATCSPASARWRSTSAASSRCWRWRCRPRRPRRSAMRSGSSRTGCCRAARCSPTASPRAGRERTRQKALFVGSALIGLALTTAIVGPATAPGSIRALAKLAAIVVSFAATWLLRSQVVFRGARLRHDAVRRAAGAPAFDAGPAAARRARRGR